MFLKLFDENESFYGLKVFVIFNLCFFVGVSELCDLLNYVFKSDLFLVDLDNDIYSVVF